MALTDYFNATWLKNNFLLGLPLVTSAGTAFPDSFYDIPIRSAIEKVGELLNLQMEAVTLTAEPYSTSMNQQAWPNFAPVQCQRRPVRSITAVDVRFGQNQVYSIPEAWWNRNIPSGEAYDYQGQIMFVPTNASVTNIALGFLWPLSFIDVQPMLYRISYTAGYAQGSDVPYALQQLIGYAAALQALELAGAIIGGIGVSNKSVGLDGLSTSRGSTKGMTNGALGGLVTGYRAGFDSGLDAARRKYTPLQMFAW